MSTTPDAVPAHDAGRAHRSPDRLADPAEAADRDSGAADAVVDRGGASGAAAAVAPAESVGSVESAPVVTPTARRRLLTILAGLAAGVLGVDQVTKAWAVSALEPGERTAVVGDLLGLSLIFNPGAALSIATGMTWVLTVIAVVVVAVIVRASRRIGSRGWAVALGLLLGGAVGNLVDRFLREPGPARGHVVDFIAYGDLFVGNVADIAIVGAAGLILVLAMRGIGLDGSREPDARRDPADAPGA